MNRFLIALLFLLTANSISYASGQLSFSQYKKNSGQFAKYLVGLEAGFSVYGVSLKQANRLYCPPTKLHLNVENIKNLIDRQIVSVEKDGLFINGDYPVALILIESLQSTFPCEDNSLH